MYDNNGMPTSEKEAKCYRFNFVKSLSAVEEKMRNMGINTIHLFYAGPIVLSYYIGEELKNNFNVVVYYRMVDIDKPDKPEIYFPVWVKKL